MRFSLVKFNDRQGMLDIKFENGDHFLIAAESVLPWLSVAPLERVSTNGLGASMTARPVAWRKMRLGETGDVIEIPTRDGIIEIPWDRVRVVADPEYRSFLTERARERAERMGKRIRAMRRKAGLTSAALASKVGVSKAVIENLEAGKIEPQIDLVQQVAGVLGLPLGDLFKE
jgi:DNA-binding XRE family transcriptional regulator